MPDLLDLENAPDIITIRIREFEKHLGLDGVRIQKWCFVGAVLCWVWALEDGVDAEYFERYTGLMWRLL